MGIAFALGISSGILSNAVQSLALTLQRKSLLSPPNRSLWRIALLTYIAANVTGSALQLATLPLLVLAPLHASGLIFNAIWASFLLEEPFTSISLLGSLLVTTGAALIAAFGAVSEPAHSLTELLLFFHKPPFIAWVVFQVVLCTTISVVCCSLTTAYTPWKVTRGILLATLSSILAAHGLLLSKTIVQLLVKTFETQNQFVHWQSWILLAAMVVIALTQLFLLNRALRLCTTTILYPLMFCIYNITALLNGMIYYSHSALLSTLQIVLISLGTLILFAGVFTLSWALNTEPPSSLILDLNESVNGSFGLRKMSPQEEAAYKLITPNEHTSLLQNTFKLCYWKTLRNVFMVHTRH